LQAVQPWMSAEDIEAGSRWGREMGEKLDKTSLGIVVVTAENLDSRWLNFEAGAVSKRVGLSEVIPVLIGLEPNDVTGPLAQFQAVRDDHDGISQLTQTLNKWLENPLAKDKLEEAVELWFPRLSTRLAAIESTEPVESEPKREVADVVSEVLERVRELQRSDEARTALLERWLTERTSEAERAFRSVQNQVVQGGASLRATATLGGEGAIRGTPK